ncbi:MAG: hypothetical protein PHY79_08025 [Anaerolineae bacterium]|nr:hypothetical protein [Anaerolineae bacterium]MDX9830476.1 hypothetical protein [Anaerolineae bacterium]
MEEPYDVDIVDQEYYPPAPRRGLSGWIIALIVIVAIVILCCLCACVAWALLAPATGNVFSSIIETIESMTPVP